MNDNHFFCQQCKGVFEKSWTDKEAQKEQMELFPEDDWKDMPLVCHDCFTAIMDFNEPGAKRYEKTT